MKRLLFRYTDRFQWGKGLPSVYNCLEENKWFWAVLMDTATLKMTSPQHYSHGGLSWSTFSLLLCSNPLFFKDSERAPWLQCFKVYEDSITTFKYFSSFSSLWPKILSWLIASIFWEKAQPTYWVEIVGGAKLRLACPHRYGNRMICHNSTHVKRCNATHDIHFLCDSEKCTVLYAIICRSAQRDHSAVEWQHGLVRTWQVAFLIKVIIRGSIMIWSTSKLPRALITSSKYRCNTYKRS